MQVFRQVHVNRSQTCVKCAVDVDKVARVYRLNWKVNCERRLPLPTVFSKDIDPGFLVYLCVHGSCVLTVKVMNAPARRRIRSPCLGTRPFGRRLRQHRALRPEADAYVEQLRGGRDAKGYALVVHNSSARVHCDSRWERLALRCRSLRHRMAATHIDQLPCDPPCLIRGQKDDHVGHVLRLTKAS